MNNEETKNLCLDLMKCNSSNDVVSLLKEKNFWDNDDVWRDYGDDPGAWGTVTSQGDPFFALTEKITNSIDAVLMNKCYENNTHPKSNDKKTPDSIYDAVNKYFESGVNFKVNQFFSNISSKDRELGHHLFWDDSYTRKISKDIAVFNVGTNDKSKYPNVVISDLGEGQTPEKFPDTILSLHKGNKENIKFTQGKWNQGGSGAINHCGTESKIEVMLIITKRNPKIIQKFPDQATAKHEEWSFTILRRKNPPKNSINVNSRAVYLTPIINPSDNKKNFPLSFKSSTFPIFPDVINGKATSFTRHVTHGTCILHYEYNIPNGSAVPSGGIYYPINKQMPRLPIPIRIYETRNKFKQSKSQTQTARGLLNFIERDQILNSANKKNSNMENISPSRDYMTVNGYKITYDIICFKKGKGDNYIDTSGVLWTVNGQTHAIQNNRFFQNQKLAFNKIQKDLLIVIDCSNITGADRENVFKGSRDRLEESNEIVKEIKKRLIEQLSEHNDLKRVIEDRISQTAKDQELDDPETVKEMEKLLEEIEDIDKDFLPEGFKIKRKKQIEKGTGDEILSKKEFPSFFKFRDLKDKDQSNQNLSKDLQIGDKLNLTLITDAKDNYLSRRNKKGKFEIYQILNDEKINLKSLNGPTLKDGICKINNIILKNKLNIGDIIKFEINIFDKQNMDGFKLNANVAIRPKQTKKITENKKKKKKKKNNKKGFQGKQEIDEPRQELIIARPVNKDKWFDKTDRQWNEDEVCHLDVTPGENGNKYFLYYNKDNKGLLSELSKADFKNPVALIEKKFQISVSLITMFTLFQYRKDKSNNLLEKVENEQNEIVVSEEASVRIATRNIGRGIFKLIDFVENKLKDKAN